MAEGPWKVYAKAVKNAVTGLIDLDTDTLVMTLHGTGYTPNQSTHETWADVSTSELTTGGGYTAGGVVLSGVTVTDSAGVVKVDCNDPSWTTFTATFRYAVITKRAGGSLTSTDKLVAYCDLTGGGTVTGGGGTQTITIAANGLFTLTPA